MRWVRVSASVHQYLLNSSTGLLSRTRLCLRGLILPLCMSLLLLSCGAPPDDALRFGLASAPVSLDPRFATDATSARINRLLYRQLVDFDDSFRPVPSLASWKIISPTHYRFTLKAEGREFHDRTVLEAQDVKATYDYVLDTANGSPHRTSLALIKEIKVRDRDTVDFYLRREDPLFPGYLVIGIVPASKVSAGLRLDRSPVGSGPFRFVAWPNDGELYLRRIQDGQALKFLHVPDSTVRVLKLLRGEIHMLQNDLPRELVRYLQQQDGITVSQRQGNNFSYIGFNMQDPALEKQQVRQAIAHAIDRGEIVQNLFGGETRLANALLPPSHWAGNPDLQGYEFNPDKARRLLAAAGFGKHQPLTLTYKTSSDPFRIRIATIIQHQLARVGIDVELRTYDWATFYGDIKAGRFQLYSLSWVGIKSPDIFEYVFHSNSVPPTGANRGRYNNAAVDRLIERAGTTSNMDKRAALYRELQAELLQSLPYVPLWYEEHFFVSRRGIEGYSIAADGNYDGLVEVGRAVTSD